MIRSHRDFDDARIDLCLNGWVPRFWLLQIEINAQSSSLPPIRIFERVKRAVSFCHHLWASFIIFNIGSRHGTFGPR
jgi:hypothetical protein